MIGWTIDVVVVLIVSSLLGAGSNALWFALLAPITLYAAELLLALYRFLKRMAVFNFFEKEGRILDTMASLQNDGFPAPKSHYEDVDGYLREAVVGSPNPEVQLSAAIALGSLVSQRIYGPRSEAICTSIVIESAIRRLPPLAD